MKRLRLNVIGDEMTLDLYNEDSHEQMRCGFLHRDDKRMGFIGVENTQNPKLYGFYTFADINQVRELRLFLEEFEKNWKENLTFKGVLIEFDNPDTVCEDTK